MRLLPYLGDRSIPGTPIESSGGENRLLCTRLFLCVDIRWPSKMISRPENHRSIKEKSWPYPHGVVALCLWLAAGCGSTDGLNRQAMSGRVTVDGRALANGAILFEPVTRQSGTAVGATIRQGAFVIPRHQGAVPGSYRVRVYASSGKQATPAKGQTDAHAASNGRMASRSLQCEVRAQGRGRHKSCKRVSLRLGD